MVAEHDLLDECGCHDGSMMGTLLGALIVG